MKNKKLSDILISKLNKEIEKWKLNNPEESPLNLAQQINSTSVFLRTLGSKIEVDYKKDLGKTTNELH